MNVLWAGIAAGIAFVVMDAALNANPLARRLGAAYGSLARSSVNVPAGIAIDLAWGLALAAMFWQLAPSLPGATGLAKGLGFGAGVWLLRVAMGAATAWMTLRLPGRLLAYQLGAGLVEMLVLGALIGLLLG